MNVEDKKQRDSYTIDETLIDETLQETIELSILFDFYGELLTDKNKEVFIEYIFNDLSLGEISEKRGITRQGIFDIIKRTSKKLREYEEALHLVKRFKVIKDNVNHIRKITNQLEQEVTYSSKDKESVSVRNMLEEINDIADNILEEL